MRTTMILAVAAAILGSLAVADDKNKPNPKQKNDEAEIRAAQEKVAAAQKEVGEANKDAQEAKQHVAKVRGELIALRRKIEDQAENSGDLKKSHDRVDQAKKTLEPLVTPILTTVQQSPEYLEGVKQRDQLRAAFAAALDRAAAARQVADAEAALRKLETVALEKSPAVVRAKAALTKAETQLREALAAADDVLLKDQRYLAAKRDLEKAENQAEAAVAKVATKQRAVAAAQNKVQSEIAEERKEDARERQQQQQKKKNNNQKK